MDDAIRKDELCRNLLIACHIFWGRVFPSKAIISNIYGIPATSWKIYACYPAVSAMCCAATAIP